MYEVPEFQPPTISYVTGIIIHLSSSDMTSCAEELFSCFVLKSARSLFTGSCWRSDVDGQTSPPPRHCTRRLRKRDKRVDGDENPVHFRMMELWGFKCSEKVLTPYLRDIQTCKLVPRRTCSDNASHCSGSQTQPCLRKDWPPPVTKKKLFVKKM